MSYQTRQHNQHHTVPAPPSLHLLRETIAQQLLTQRILGQHGDRALDALLRHSHLPSLQKAAPDVPVQQRQLQVVLDCLGERRLRFADVVAAQGGEGKPRPHFGVVAVHHVGLRQCRLRLLQLVAQEQRLAQPQPHLRAALERAAAAESVRGLVVLLRLQVKAAQLVQLLRLHVSVPQRQALLVARHRLAHALIDEVPVNEK